MFIRSRSQGVIDYPMLDLKHDKSIARRSARSPGDGAGHQSG